MAIQAEVRKAPETVDRLLAQAIANEEAQA